MAHVEVETRAFGVVARRLLVLRNELAALSPAEPAHQSVGDDGLDDAYASFAADWRSAVEQFGTVVERVAVVLGLVAEHYALTEATLAAGMTP